MLMTLIVISKRYKRVLITTRQASVQSTIFG